MASRSGARSALDATRFTSTTPHATSKAPLPPGGVLQETPEQRVRRLRAAHLAAQNARVSKFDRVVGGSRRFFDGAQRVTIWTLVGFTLLAGLATTYSVVDMVRYNRKRRDDFTEAKKKMEDDELAAARLAFINGTATDEQIALVEDANLKAQTAGFKLPPLLGPTTSSTASPGPTADGGAVSPGFKVPILTKELGTVRTQSQAQDQGSKPNRSWSDWWFSSLKKSEEGDDVGTSERRLGWESLSEEDDSAGVRESDLIRAIEEKKALFRDKAQASLEREKERQRKGGMLDQIGLDKPATPEKKKGWWPW